jgi:uncharacterized membrane protein
MAARCAALGDQVLLMSIFVYTFFKFAWAFRLTHYTAILIGVTCRRLFGLRIT